MSELWSEKHAPRDLRELAGQGQAIKQILEWAESWRMGKPKKRGLLLYGAAGTGKTVAAATLSRQMGWDLIELNASDKRTFKVIKHVAGTAATTGTLFAGATGKRLIVLDEADNVYGVADRGGYRAISELLKEARNPVVLIANNLYAIPYEIRGLCLPLNFRRLTEETVAKALERICRAEHIEADPLALNVIAETAQGDLRSAINDLQAMATGKHRLKISDLALYHRDREADVFKVLSRLLQASTCKDARALLWSLDMPPEDALAWINENIPRTLTDPADLARVYDALSRADIFFSRARRKRAFKMWGYANDLMTAGVALARHEQPKYVRFQLPTSISRFARTRASRAVRDSVAKKIASRCHVSSRDARKHYMPYFAVILKHNEKAGAALAKELELGDAEKKYLGLAS